MPQHHYKGRHAVYIGMVTPFTSEQPRRLCRNIHSVHFGMATPFGRNLHNELCYAESDSKIIRICEEIDLHFDRAQREYSTLEWLFKRKIEFDELFAALMGYVQHTYAVLIAKRDKDEQAFELAKIDSMFLSNTEIEECVKLWIPLVKKHESNEVFNSYIEADKIQNSIHNANKYRTIEEIEKEMRQNGKVKI